jgi:hypothetical protein
LIEISVITPFSINSFDMNIVSYFTTHCWRRIILKDTNVINVVITVINKDDRPWTIMIWNYKLRLVFDNSISIVNVRIRNIHRNNNHTYIRMKCRRWCQSIDQVLWLFLRYYH